MADRLVLHSRLATADVTIPLLLKLALIAPLVARTTRHPLFQVAERGKSAGNRKLAERRQHPWQRRRRRYVTAEAVLAAALRLGTLEGRCLDRRRGSIIHYDPARARRLVRGVHPNQSVCKVRRVRLPKSTDSAVELLARLVCSPKPLVFNLGWRSEVPAAKRAAFQARGIGLAKGHASSPWGCCWPRHRPTVPDPVSGRGGEGARSRIARPYPLRGGWPVAGFDATSACHKVELEARTKREHQVGPRANSRAFANRTTPSSSVASPFEKHSRTMLVTLSAS